MTSNPRRSMIAVAESLPPLSLPRAGSTSRVAFCHGTQASVLVWPHPAGCAECQAYLAALDGIVEDLRLWGTRLLVVVPAEADGTGPAVLIDGDGEARARLGISEADVAVIVADRYGAVYQVTAAGADHFLPDPRDLVGMAKFIDIQCPECEVPSAEWRQSCPLPLG